jgi:hypothetical protein
MPALPSRGRHPFIVKLHLDRKLERMLAMLLRLRDLWQAVPS